MSRAFCFSSASYQNKVAWNQFLHEINCRTYLSREISDHRIIIAIIGLLSAIVVNVPLAAARMGMYPLSSYPTDHFIWEFLTFCAGTGGSILVIGSAAGVAAMGMERIGFIWYLRKISFLALLG